MIFLSTVLLLDNLNCDIYVSGLMVQNFAKESGFWLSLWNAGNFLDKQREDEIIK